MNQHKSNTYSVKRSFAEMRDSEVEALRRKWREAERYYAVRYPHGWTLYKPVGDIDILQGVLETHLPVKIVRVVEES